MARVIGGVRHRVTAGFGLVAETLRERRRRWQWLDHLARAFGRYDDKRGDRLAAAITFYGFLSFFPLVALAYAALGFLVGVSDEARDYLVQAINELLPGLADDIRVEQIAQARAAAGVIGVVGLVYAGLGCMNALREALRDIWLGDPTGGGNFLLKKLYDIGTLAFLGTVMILSVAGSTITGQASHAVLDWLGLDRTPGAGTVLRLLTLAVTIGFNTLIFLMLFSRVSGTLAPWRTIVRGALFGAVGFEILKQVGTLLVAQTARNPVYASFAVVAGLLVWIDVVSRFVIFAAAWTATHRAVLRADAANEANKTSPGQDPRTDDDRTGGTGDQESRDDGTAGPGDDRAARDDLETGTAGAARAAPAVER